MERQSTSGYGGFSSPLLRMFSEQKVDAWFGLSFFFVGFAFKGSSGLGYKTSDFGLVNAATVALVAVLALYHFVRETLTRYLFRNSLKTPRHPANPTKPRLDENTIEELWNGTV